MILDERLHNLIGLIYETTLDWIGFSRGWRRAWLRAEET